MKSKKYKLIKGPSKKSDLDQNCRIVLLIVPRLIGPPTMLQSCSLVSAYDVVSGETKMG